VTELEHARTADAGARQQRVVDELVEDDQVAGAEERRDRADVREIAAAEHDAVLGAFERRELALELAVQRMIAVDETRRPGAYAEATRGLDARGDDLRVLR
jgi:hypothetical protein